MTVLGGFLSFLLVFRTNTCYARWWEARCHWGRLSMRHSQSGRTWLRQHEDLSERLLKTIIVFAFASKAQLRGLQPHDQLSDGKQLVERGLLDELELDDMASQEGWQPWYCLDVLHAVCAEAFLRGGVPEAALPPHTRSPRPCATPAPPESSMASSLLDDVPDDRPESQFSLAGLVPGGLLAPIARHFSHDHERRAMRVAVAKSDSIERSQKGPLPLDRQGGLACRKTRCKYSFAFLSL